jgi:hypothetical protein
MMSGEAPPVCTAMSSNNLDGDSCEEGSILLPAMPAAAPSAIVRPIDSADISRLSGAGPPQGLSAFRTLVLSDGHEKLTTLALTTAAGQRSAASGSHSVLPAKQRLCMLADALDASRRSEQLLCGRCRISLLARSIYPANTPLEKFQAVGMWKTQSLKTRPDLPSSILRSIGTRCTWFCRYEILTSLERRAGGQGCVQFIFDKTDRIECAAKFFFQRHTFERECLLYSNPELHGVMAATREVCPNHNAAHVAANGTPYPSFIVLERGESLDEWLLRQSALTEGSAGLGLDIVTAVQVRGLPIRCDAAAVMNLVPPQLMHHRA